MITEPAPHLLEEAQVYAVRALPDEACGVFFYPDQRIVIGTDHRQLPGAPRFVRVPNSAADPRRSFAFDYDTMARNITLTYWGMPHGQVQLWHSHPDDSGPSVEDFAMVTLLEEAMAGHPTWGMAPNHRLLSVSSNRWHSYTATFSEALT